jgi:hypothetical protein
MATAKQNKLPDLSGPFYRVLHSLLRPGRDEAEVARAEATWKWLSRRPELRKRCAGPRKDILIAIWKPGTENQTLLSFSVNS